MEFGAGILRPLANARTKRPGPYPKTCLVSSGVRVVEDFLASFGELPYIAAQRSIGSWTGNCRHDFWLQKILTFSIGNQSAQYL